ncbi:hypothetical protein [Pseudooceanicola nanhaiensis]|uniref:hypothetical protein n=1 Tax=Pseudooceanicola nanhaiensis TaxID=375761 RepID=UPI001CD646E1|nr:hypothetical protein [Pseudooceanicola nanhaiensis]MCA0923005.1 hypothetical protein [Pseudooceanicola nanhaiensis]
MKYTVLRPHQGDKWYGEGAAREARETEVQHLVDRGVLAKAEPEPRNKAVKAPRTKAAT